MTPPDHWCTYFDVGHTRVKKEQENKLKNQKNDWFLNKIEKKLNQTNFEKKWKNNFEKNYYSFFFGN